MKEIISTDFGVIVFFVSIVLFILFIVVSIATRQEYKKILYAGICGLIIIIIEAVVLYWLFSL